MTPIAADLTRIADALHMDTHDLARVLAGLAREQLETTGRKIDFARRPGGALTLDEFDEEVARARALLEDAWAARKAWEQDIDGPDDPPEDDGA